MQPEWPDHLEYMEIMRSIFQMVIIDLGTTFLLFVCFDACCLIQVMLI
jgi:hypothetical protein